MFCRNAMASKWVDSSRKTIENSPELFFSFVEAYETFWSSVENQHGYELTHEGSVSFSRTEIRFRKRGFCYWVNFRTFKKVLANFLPFFWNCRLIWGLLHFYGTFLLDSGKLFNFFRAGTTTLYQILCINEFHCLLHNSPDVKQCTKRHPNHHAQILCIVKHIDMHPVYEDSCHVHRDILTLIERHIPCTQRHLLCRVL